MEVILLERVAKLGQMGEVVRVKDGFARNFLLPKGKALRATKENRTRFETMKVELEARSLELKSEAGKISGKLDGKRVVVLRQASETGQLYGSVTPRDIVALLAEDGLSVNRGQIVLQEDIGDNTPLGKVWLYDISSDTLTQVARHDPDRFAVGAPDFITIDEESSGVIDASSILGSGWYLLDVQSHKASADPELVEGGQLLAMHIAPGKFPG